MSAARARVVRVELASSATPRRPRNIAVTVSDGYDDVDADHRPQACST